MEGAERDTTQEWLLPEGAGPPTIGELELRVDEALTIARSSERAVSAIGDAALEAARQAGRAAELAESASAAALDVRRAVFERAGGHVAPERGAGTEQAVAQPAAESRQVAEPVNRNGGGDDPLQRFSRRADRLATRLRAVCDGRQLRQRRDGPAGLGG